jgi:hypothetical protein
MNELLFNGPNITLIYILDTLNSLPNPDMITAVTITHIPIGSAQMIDEFEDVEGFDNDYIYTIINESYTRVRSLFDALQSLTNIQKLMIRDCNLSFFDLRDIVFPQSITELDLQNNSLYIDYHNCLDEYLDGYDDAFNDLNNDVNDLEAIYRDVNVVVLPIENVNITFPQNLQSLNLSHNYLQADKLAALNLPNSIKNLSMICNYISIPYFWTPPTNLITLTVVSDHNSSYDLKKVLESCPYINIINLCDENGNIIPLYKDIEEILNERQLCIKKLQSVSHAISSLSANDSLIDPDVPTHISWLLTHRVKTIYNHGCKLS